MTDEVKTFSSDSAVNPDMNKVDGKDAEAKATAEVELDLGGVKVKVAPSVAAALETANKAAREAGESAAALREQYNALAAKLDAVAKPTQKQQDELAVLFFTEPEVAIAKLEERIMEKFAAATAKTEAQREFWTEFYRANKDLEEHDGYVRYVFQRDFDSMKKSGLTVADAIKKVGETVKGEIVKIRGTRQAPGKPVAEGKSDAGNQQSGSESNANVSGDSPNIGLTGSILAERKAARQAAKQPGRKK